jgi:hypothetical protein
MSNLGHCMFMNMTVVVTRDLLLLVGRNERRGDGLNM